MQYTKKREYKTSKQRSERVGFGKDGAEGFGRERERERDEIMAKSKHQHIAADDKKRIEEFPKTNCTTNHSRGLTIHVR